MFLHWVYILRSASANRYYIGQTGNIENRIKHHIAGRETYTKRSSDWKLVFSLECSNKGEALKIEKFIKQQKSKIFIEKVIDGKIDLKLK